MQQANPQTTEASHNRGYFLFLLHACVSHSGVQADRGPVALELGRRKHRACKTVRKWKDEEGEKLLGLNYLRPDRTYITSAHSPLARTGHMAETKLQGLCTMQGNMYQRALSQPHIKH